MTTKTIGFDRELKLRWLDTTVDLVLQGLEEKDVITQLKTILEKDIPNRGARDAKSKTITVLLHIWVKVPDIVKSLRDDAIKLLHQSDCNRLIFHWGLCLATYPFFAFVSETIGRLAKLQGNFSSIHIQRRAKEQYGDRETVSRAVNRIIQSLIDWRIIRETTERRIFEVEKPISVPNELLTAWLIEAVLISSSKKSASLKTIINSLALFPFKIELLSSKILEKSERLDVFRHGLDDEIAVLINKKDKSNVPHKSKV